ncbi:MAG TPA: imelysin family protein [Candidatus Sulfotelmatobacter sp.]|nr:imelysin family protein [Candidatus Sulfotelmatobacter sp.]
MTKVVLSGAFHLFCLAGWCGFPVAGFGAETNQIAALKTSIILNYAILLHAEYEDSLAGARNLNSAIDQFIAKPSPATLQAARNAWVKARNPYLQTEVGRFYDGPIEPIEGFINAWPVDESYIDYTVSDPNAGIVNQADLFPVISREVLIAANEKDGEKNVSTGYHAMEFLLWGQALDPVGPGNRPSTDYLPAAHNYARRALCLQVIASLLVEYMTTLEREWRDGVPDNYRSKFLARPPDEALGNILNGLGNFSGTELSGERLLTPYTTKDRRDQHSCFSDMTCLDLTRNEIGIQNVYLGQYKSENGTLISGPGLYDLLRKTDPALAETMKKQIQQAVDAFKAIPPPFEKAISGLDTDPGRVAVRKTLDALQAQTASIANAATTLGIRLNLQAPQ